MSPHPPKPRRTLRSVEDLVAAGLVRPQDAADIDAVTREFSVAVSDEVAGLIDPAAAGDPIAAQYLPDRRELTVLREEREDPIGDEAYSPLKGIVHRYPDRVLLKALHVCPVYCRFCFRREVVGTGSEALSAPELDRALAYIAAHPEVWEVILTGGDPLMLSSEKIARIVEALDAVAHVRVMRVHTRIPVADPARVSPTVVAALRRRKATWVVVHCNHARELTENAREAIGRLVDAGIPVLSQSVLLRGVNDTPDTLEALFRALVECRVKPYYLHHPDLAKGTSHFRPTIAHGQRVTAALRGRLSGIAQPTYVLDIPGGHGKVPVGERWIERTPDGAYAVRDFRGEPHAYRDATDDAPGNADDATDDGKR